MAQTYNGSLSGIPSIQVSEKSPLDVRTVVDSYTDLITKWDGVDGHPGIQNLYTGIVVYVKETSLVYVLVGTPKNSNKEESWKIVGDIAGLASEEWVESQGYLKAEDLPDYLTDSDVEDFAKKSDIPSVDGFATEEWVESQKYLKAEDLPDYLTDSDVAEFATKEELNDYIKVEELPTNVSAFINDAGYLTVDDIPDYLTDSDLDDFAKKSDIPDVSDFAKKSDIPSVEGLATEEWVESLGYLKAEDLPDYLTDSDLDDFAKKSDIPSVEGLASESWVEGKGYLTEHQDISGKADKSEIPTKVSDLTNDAGYLKVEDLPDYLTDSDVEGFATKAELDDYLKVEELPTNVSEFVNDAGYLKAEDLPDYLTDSDLDDFAKKSDIPTEGVFPDVDGSDDSDAGIDGFATVDAVIEYVNALFEKKKAEDDGIRYAYITGYGLEDTATDITQFNPFLLNSTGDTVIEFNGPQELPLYDQNDNELPCLKVTIDIPESYSISEFYIWNTLLREYQESPCEQNLRYSTRVINGVTYNSYVRGYANSIQPRGTAKYKIIITKQ